MQKKLMTGNEAVARGAYEAGVRFVTAYPGTPSTEITENAAKYQEIIAEWAPNEKVALESGLGASIAGARSLVSMKHVGLNVAADPLFTAAYTGVNGGLVIVSADDPGMHSSQNEQDNRHYGRAAKVPVLEPSDSEEALLFTKAAFVISEEFDTPVILRLTTRVSHSHSMVSISDREEVTLKEYQKNPAKYVMIPGHAKKRHVEVEKRLLALKEMAEKSSLNRMELSDLKIGIICSGTVYQYVKEVLPEASILKLGIVYPLAKELITEFSSKVAKLYVIEELEPFIEDTVKSWGIEVQGRELFSPLGEIFPEDIAEKIKGIAYGKRTELRDLPARPPVMCAGCPHRGIFFILSRMNLTVTGDIGCYTLACLPPLSAMDTTICMGASIGNAHGFIKAREDYAGKTVAVLGESTFIHSGVTGLINVAYNQSPVTTIILDNSITAMTGHQHNPASGRNAKGEPAPALDLVALVKACGISHVEVVDPLDLKAAAKAVKDALVYDGPAVVITKRPCVLINKKQKADETYQVDQDKCIGCKVCLKIGCPALGMIKKDGEEKALIDITQCTNCGLCASLCPKKAIVAKKEGE